VEQKGTRCSPDDSGAANDRPARATGRPGDLRNLDRAALRTAPSRRAGALNPEGNQAADTVWSALDLVIHDGDVRP
jgi:hypothetical protein